MTTLIDDLVPDELWALVAPLLPAPPRLPYGGRYRTISEAFWSRMQVELLDRHRWKTRIELANAILEYLEIFHNRQRRHSSLGMLTPIQFENPSTVP